MKSKLFSRGGLSKDFSEDLHIVMGLDFTPARLKLAARSTSDWILAREPKTESEALDRLRQGWRLSPKEMEAVLGIGGFLLRELDEEDCIDDIMEDLEVLAVVVPEELPKVRQFIDAFLAEFMGRFAEGRLAISTQNSGLKIVKGITHLVDLRPVISKRMELGDNVKSYQPRVKGLVPVIILRLRLSGDEECVFQMDRATVRNLQDILQGGERELEETIKFVGRGKISLVRYRNTSE